MASLSALASLSVLAWLLAWPLGCWWLLAWPLGCWSRWVLQWLLALRWACG